MVERQNNYSQNLDKKETKTNKEAGIKYNKEKDKILSDTKKLLEEEKNIISRLEVEGYEYYYNNPKIRKLTQQILDIYDKKHKGRKFYVTESNVTRGDHEVNNNAEMIIKIDNRIGIIDTTILSDGAFEKVFGKNNGRNDYQEMEDYVKYLNIVKDKK